MKHHTKSVPASRALALASALALTVASASAQLIESFQFNDVASTGLTSVSNSISGGASFATNITDVTTTGSGALRIASNASGAAARSFADIADITSGIVQIDVNVAGWNLVGAPASNGPLLEVGLSAATTGNNAAIRTAHIFFDADSTVGATLAGVAGGTGSLSTPGSQDQVFDFASGGLLRTSPITFRLIANFDTLAYSISNSDTSYLTLSTGTMAASKGGNFLSIRALDNFALGGTGFFDIDSITLTAIPEPSSFAALAGLVTLGFAASRRRRR